MTVMTTQRLAFSVVEVGELLGTSRTSVFRLIKSGELESIKIGGSRRVTPEQLDRFLTRLQEAREAC